MMLAFAPVFVTLLVQLMIWPLIRPFAWFLFTPAVFLSAWIGGRMRGILASVIATLLVWYFFLPQRSFGAARPAADIVSAAVFLGMGVVFSLFHDRLKRTQRRAAEAITAIHCQAQLESVFQAMQDGIVVTDMQGAFILVNEAEARMNGFPSAAAMKQNLAFYRKLYELRHPNGTPVPFEEWPINRVLRGESITNLELRARRLDTGQEWLLSFCGEPVRDEQEKQILAVIGIRDISEQKRAEESLRASEKRFRAMFENATAGIARVAPDGHYLEINQRWCDILGYTREELLAMTFGEITHPDDLQADMVVYRQMLAGTVNTYLREKRYFRKDGSITWANLNVSVVRKTDGSPDYFISVVEDISDRKRAEKNMRESGERLQLALRAAELGVFEWNVQTDRAIWENERMYEIFGHTRADGTLSKAQLLENYVHPDDVATLDQALAEGMKSGHPVHIVYRIRRKDGVIRWLDLASDFELAHDGTPIRMIGVLADITERHQAEQKLRASELRLRTMVSAIPSLSYEGDSSGNNTFVSDQWLAYTGMTVEETAGRGFLKSFHPDDAVVNRARYEAAVQSGTLFESRIRIRAADGSYRWFLNRAMPARDANGRVVLWVGSFTDIDDLIRAEERLRQNELRFRTIISAVPSLTFEADVDGNNIFVSDQWFAYTGMTADETAGDGYLRAYHPDDVENMSTQWSAAVLSGNSFESKCRIRGRDGGYRWFLNRAQPGRDTEGSIVRWAGSLTDIDDLIRAEERLRESKERLAGIVSTAMDAIIAVDEDQRVVLFNEAAERMFGCRAADAMGQPLDRFIPQCFHRANSHDSLTALRADGTEFPIEAAISNIDVGGRKLYTIIHRDITERKQAEAEHEKLMQEQLARAAAEAASRSKDEFLAMVSHELRSPLTAILGYGRILRSGPTDGDLVNKAAAVIERSAKSQLRIIEDLLDSARIIAGKLRIELEPVDLVPVLEAALDTARPAAEAKGVKLVANFSRAPEPTFGDSTRLQQIVWNLLTNAVKFTPEGGWVELRMEGAVDHIRITVSDNGKGIEPQFLPFIFDRFRQADTSSSRRVGGLGLGLSLVKNLVELHGGTISVASEAVGRGSIFTVTLPRRQFDFLASPIPAAVPREVRTDSALALDQAPSLKDISVLLVDDQEEARAVLTQILSEYGANVTALSSGEEALALLARPNGSRPDVLILDIAMPGEDGYSVLKKVRALEARQGETQEIPAIALTAFARTEDRLRVLQAGFRMHVAKPVEPAELAVIISSLTNRRSWDRAPKKSA
jgi:PAS domain S-box-containing protein